MRAWSDYIKIQKLDLKLTKREPSLRFNVDDVTIYLWEKNRVWPSLAQIPKIIEFLDRDPFEKETENLGDRIREYRRFYGLSQKKLGVHQITMAEWEIGEYMPSKKLVDKLSLFLFTHHENALMRTMK